MVATICLLTGALVVAQPPDRADAPAGPRLTRGQELVYRGAVTEEASARGVQFTRAYRLESRVFVLDTSLQGMDVAFFTVLKLRTGPGDRGKDAEPSSVRLEVGRVDAVGRLAADPGVTLAVPFDGPATVECGAFLELPRARLVVGHTWQTAEPGRPPRTWRVTGSETVSGTACLRLEGVQQSDDWDQPRADRAAWRRRDSIWLAPRLGVALRVERTIERREPARAEPTQRSQTRYELESSLQYPGQLYEDRRREILQARAFADAVAPLLPNPGQHGPRPFEAMAAKIAHHVDNHPPTPYREALLLVKRRVEAAKRGEAPPPPLPDDTATPGVVTGTGRPAPDFVATNLLTRDSGRLGRWLGRPVLLVFYTPQSATAEELLRFAQGIHEGQRGAVTVVGLAMVEDVDRIRQQQEELRLGFPVLSGKGLRHLYAVEVTPKLLVLDGHGIVRGIFEGWGLETPASVLGELRRCLPAPASTPPAGGTGKP